MTEKHFLAPTMTPNAAFALSRRAIGGSVGGKTGIVTCCGMVAASLSMSGGNKILNIPDNWSSISHTWLRNDSDLSVTKRPEHKANSSSVFAFIYRFISFDRFQGDSGFQLRTVLLPLNRHLFPPGCAPLDALIPSYGPVHSSLYLHSQAYGRKWMV